MNILTSDFECTTFNNGNPFDQRNKAVCLGFKRGDTETDCYFDVNEPFEVAEFDLYVFFNAKYDCHWYRKLGVDISSWKIWDTQLGEFVLSGQTIRFPSLEDTAVKYGLGHKLDIIKLEYWQKGINTDEIPQDILAEYCCQDVDLTYAIYLKQLEQFQQNPQLFKLFKLMCQDLLVLEEMEWNGLLYDPQLCHQRSQQLTIEINEIQEQLASIHPGLFINWASNDQLSAVLYGGTIYETVKEFDGFYGPKAQKAGQPKYKTIVKEHILPRLVEPLKGSEVKKEGKNSDGTTFKYYKTDEGTLRKLKGAAAKKYVEPLLRLSELQKLVGTYYEGLPKMAKEHCWPENMIHGQFHQVVAQTGRLSSSKPNLQNFAGDCQDVFVSRYA